MLEYNFPEVDAAPLLPPRPLCFPNDSAGWPRVQKPGYPNTYVTLDQNKWVIKLAGLDGSTGNIKMNIRALGQNWDLVPVLLVGGYCQGVYVGFLYSY
jgi:hypothetical protein